MAKRSGENDSRRKNKDAIYADLAGKVLATNEHELAQKYCHSREIYPPLEERESKYLAAGFTGGFLLVVQISCCIIVY
jgi:hypothetical protein